MIVSAIMKPSYFFVLAPWRSMKWNKDFISALKINILWFSWVKVHIKNVKRFWDVPEHKENLFSCAQKKSLFFLANLRFLLHFVSRARHSDLRANLLCSFACHWFLLVNSQKCASFGAAHKINAPCSNTKIIEGFILA